MLAGALMKYKRLSSGWAMMVPLHRASGARHSFARRAKVKNIHE